MKTLTEVMEWLKRLDEVILLEVLEISSEDIIERFSDKIEDKYDELQADIDEDDEEDDL